jgi:hypothetical protein
LIAALFTVAIVVCGAVWIAAGILALHAIWRWGYRRGSADAYEEIAGDVVTAIDHAFRAGYRTSVIASEPEGSLALDDVPDVDSFLAQVDEAKRRRV